MSRGDMKQLRRVRLTVSAERAVLVAGVLPGEIEPEEEPLAELRRLAETAGAAVVGEVVQKLRAPAPRTFIGKGKVGELKRLAAGLDARTAIFDNELTCSGRVDFNGLDVVFEKGRDDATGLF